MHGNPPPTACPRCGGPVFFGLSGSACDASGRCPVCRPRPPLPHGGDTLFTLYHRQSGRLEARTRLPWSDVERLAGALAVVRIEIEPLPGKAWKDAIERFGTSE